MVEKEELEKLWIEYVRGSNGEWKKYHSKFIDAHIERYNAAIKWQTTQPGGKQKIIDIFGIKNLDAVPMVK